MIVIKLIIVYLYLFLKKKYKKDKLFILKTIHHMKENGMELLNKDMAFKNGLMDHLIKVIGFMIWLMVQVNLYIQMVLLIMELGLETKHQDMEFLFILSNRDMKVSGKMIYSMGMEKNIYQTDLIIKANFKMD